MISLSDEHSEKQLFLRVVTVCGIETSVSDEHFEKQFASIVFIGESINNFLINWQPKNAFSPIDSTDFGIVISGSAEHPLKAWLPIDVIDDGRFTFFNEEQLLKVFLSIDVTDSGIEISDSEEQS